VWFSLKRDTYCFGKGPGRGILRGQGERDEKAFTLLVEYAHKMGPINSD